MYAYSVRMSTINSPVLKKIRPKLKMHNESRYGTTLNGCVTMTYNCNELTSRRQTVDQLISKLFVLEIVNEIIESEKSLLTENTFNVENFYENSNQRNLSIFTIAK